MAAGKFSAFVDLIEECADLLDIMPLPDFYDQLLLRTGYLAMLEEKNDTENRTRAENVRELRSSIVSYCENSDNPTLNGFLEEIALVSDVDNYDECANSVVLMTVHAAKGLEFSNIFIVGVEEDLFPSAMANNSIEEIEEERRLLYVAITRAKKFCMMSYASSRYRNGTTCTTSPSRFLRDIDTKYLALSSGSQLTSPQRSFSSYSQSYHSSSLRPIGSSTRPLASRATPSATTSTAKTAEGYHSVNNLSEGMVIEHSRFGRGTITNIDVSHADPRITVDFNNLGSRVLLLKFARFNIIG